MEQQKYSTEYKQEKMLLLAEIEGIDLDNEDEMLSIVLDSVAPSICMNDGCDYTTEMEPDQDRGWCEVCQTNTVVSILILMGVI